MLLSQARHEPASRHLSHTPTFEDCIGADGRYQHRLHPAQASPPGPGPFLPVLRYDHTKRLKQEVAVLDVVGGTAQTLVDA